MSELTYNCKFCNKDYKSLSSLNYHQKTAKFCIQIQNTNKDNKDKSEKCICEYCSKEFTSKKTLVQHLDHCKDKKKVDSNNQYEKEIDKLKLTIDFKDQLIAKYEKEINDYKKLLSRPTTIVNNANTTHTNNNYQIQYNQLVQNTEPLLPLSLSNKIKSITIEEMDNYDPKNLEDSVSHTLSNRLKDYTFCTDKSRKMVVIKKENDETEKITIKEFINMCLNTGIVDIQKYLKALEEHYDAKLVNYTISDENFTLFDDSLQKIKEYMNKSNIDITDIGHPLKMLPDKVLLNCRYLTK